MITITSFVTLVYGRYVFGDGVCITSSTVLIMCFVCTSYTVTLMTVNVYMIIIYPLRYDTMVTFRRVLLATVAIWMFSVFFVGLCHYINDNQSEYVPIFYSCMMAFRSDVKVLITLGVILFACPVPCSVIQVYCNIKIYRTARAQKIKVNPSMRGKKMQESSNQTIAGRIKELKTVLAVTGTFLCAWIPISVEVLLGQLFQIQTSPKITFFTLYSVVVKSALNWLIYSIAYPPYRVAQHALLTRIIRGIRRFIDAIRLKCSDHS